MEIYGKMAVFRADMAGLGKYCMGGYGRIGVYRVKQRLLMVLSGGRPTLHRNLYREWSRPITLTGDIGIS